MLQYLTFASISQFIPLPTDCHIETMKYILSYLKATIADEFTYIKTVDSGHSLLTVMQIGQVIQTTNNLCQRIVFILAATLFPIAAGNNGQ